MSEKTEGWGVCLWGGERGLKESLHPLTHPPLFLAQFFKTCLFLWLVRAEPFLNKTGRHAEKACRDREVALCRLNRVIPRRGGGEENGSRGTGSV